jgi:sugar phosphate isomerase/epimerase
MTYSRRTFIRNSAFAAAATGILPKAPIGAFKKEYVGLQLYSVRDAMGKDASGTLKGVADIGYKYVEHAGYGKGKFYGYAPADFKKLLDGYGLKMVSGHSAIHYADWDEGKKDFSDSWKQTVADAATAGQEYVVTPWLDEQCRTTYDLLLKWMDIFNKCGELCKSHGMKFGYHNHDWEFSTVLNNQKIYDIIMQKTDASLVAQQLDMGNLYNGGAVAIAIVMQYPGRYDLMHVKDEIKATSTQQGGERYESTTLGDGVVSTKQVCDQGKKGGTKYFIVEQESYQGKPPIDCCKTDLETMKKWGY